MARTQGGIYHSIYDDFYWYTHFADTNFVYGRALAQTIGTAVMRLADAQLIPFDFTGLAETVGKYARSSTRWRRTRRTRSIELNREIRDGVFAAVERSRAIRRSRPTRSPTPPHLDFAPLENGVDALTRAAAQYAAGRGRQRAGGAGSRLATSSWRRSTLC